jgi:hypothetical protein
MRIITLFLLLNLALWLVACGQPAETTPTAVPPEQPASGAAAAAAPQLVKFTAEW